MATRKFEVNAHVELPPNVARALYTLALVHKTTVADLVEKGIALLITALKAQQQGYELAVVDQNGEVVADITGLPTVSEYSSETAEESQSPWSMLHEATNDPSDPKADVGTAVRASIPRALRRNLE